MAFTPADQTKAEVRIVGTAPNQQLDFYIPRGAKGEPGGFTEGALLGTANLNDILVPGIYRQTNSSGTSSPLTNNYPSAGAYGVLTVHRTNGNDIIQQFSKQNYLNTVDARCIFQRNLSNGVWSPWRTFASTRIDQTAGRVIYQWDETNAREQLIYGDTGLRRIETEFKNGWSAAIASLRRVGNVVTFGTYSVSPTARTADIAYTIPNGFRPGSYGGNIATPVRYSGTASTEWQQVTGPGDVYPPVGAISSNGFICVGSWITSDTWPTTLPGTASGTIPNA